VRWDDLFDDLTAQVEHAQRLHLADEVTDRIRRDEATVALVDRVRAGEGELTLVLRDGSRVVGHVAGAGPDWILVREGWAQRQVLVPASAVSAVHGLARRSAAPWGPVAARRTLLLAVRALARAGEPVLVRAVAVTARGSIGRVGADHLDVLVEESADGPGGPVSIPFGALLSVAELG
jgi:microcompartment protein CcmK/EutM